MDSLPALFCLLLFFGCPQCSAAAANSSDPKQQHLVLIPLNNGSSRSVKLVPLLEEQQRASIVLGDQSVGVEWTGCEEVDANPPTLDELSRIIYSILMPIVCLLGSIGALICVFIFTRRQMRSSLSIYLAALSSFDFVLLVCATVIYPSMNLCLQDGNRGAVCHFFWRTSLATYPISLMAQTASVWTVVAITVDRYLAVKYPLHMRAWCTAHRARTVVFYITLVAILFKMPSFFEVTLDECGRLMKTELREHDLYFFIYYTYGYLLLMLAAPFLFIVILNTLVLSIIRKANVARREMRVVRRQSRPTTAMVRGSRASSGGFNALNGRGSGGSWIASQLNSNTQQPHNGNSSGTPALHNSAPNNASFMSNSSHADCATVLDSRCTKMAVVTISAFVAFNWLAGINHVIEAFKLFDDGGQPSMRIPIGNFLVCLNSATNILIYSLFGRRFRRMFVHQFCPCLEQKYDSLTRSTCLNKTELV